MKRLLLKGSGVRYDNGWIEYLVLNILVLGGTGMLGHKLWQFLAEQFDTYMTLRQGFESYARYNLFDRTRTTVQSQHVC